MSENKSFARVLIAVSAAAVVMMLLCLALTAQPTQAATYRDVPVGGSIQAAIDAAATGDIIRVQQGTFTESLTINKSVALLGGFTDFTTGARTPRTTVISPTGRAMNITGAGITVTVDGFEITNAAYAGSGAGMYVVVNADSKVVINNNSIHHSRATSGSGGGIYAHADTRSAIELTGNDVMTNTASSDGGGIYADIGGWSEFVLTGTDIISNSASNGGGFYASVRATTLALADQSASDSSSFTIQDDLVMSNTATTNYGGVYLTVQSRQGDFDRNRVIGNRANGSYGGGNLTLMSSSSTFYNNEFRRNVAAASNGGLQAGVVFNSSLIGDGLVVADNQATSSGTGGLSIVADLMSSLDLPNSVITGNLAQNDYGGGSLAASNGSRLSIPSAVVQNNRSISGSVGGLVLTAYNGWITATQMTVISNTAPNQAGGVAGIVQLGSLILTGSDFERNTSTNGAGGLYVGSIVGGALLDVSGSHFFTNTGSIGGGASFGSVSMNSALLLNNTSFVSNTAQGTGGGLMIGSIDPTSQAEIDPSHFERNVAQTGDGGGIYLGSSVGQFSLTSADLLHNWAGGNGGGMFLGNLQLGQAEINGNRIISNVASTAAGGGIYMGGVIQLNSLEMTNNTVSRNTAGGPGGGIFMGSASQVNSLEMTSNTLSLNTANGPGGGLYLSALDTASWLMNGSVITGNSTLGSPGNSGGGIYLGTVNNAPTMDLDNSQVNDNSATGDGGGLFIGNLRASVLTMRNSQLLRNKAMGAVGPTNGGGGCSIVGAVNSSQVWLDNTQVNGNVTNGSGGGCLLNNFNLNTLLAVHNSQFNNNMAGVNAGGVSLFGHGLNARIEFFGNQVNGNQAGITATLPTATGGQSGGIWLFLPAQAQATLTDNEIRNNTAYLGTFPDSGTCGGVCVNVALSTLTLQDNLLSGNTAERDFGGLSVVMPASSKLSMEHNVIASNTAITNVGGINVQGGGNSQYDLRRNQIISNTAGAKGGVWITGLDPTLVITSQNNLIALNAGSGLYLQDANFQSTNDTLADNGAYGIVLTGTLGVTTTARLTNTILWGHTESFTSTQVPTYTMLATFSDIQGGWSGAGNLDTDPLFSGGGNYHLQPTSPVKDQADTAHAPAVDLDGNPRPYNTVADIGCYEYGLYNRVYLPVVIRN